MSDDSLRARLTEWRKEIDDACTDEGWWYSMKISEMLQGTVEATDEEFTAKVARIAREVLKEELGAMDLVEPRPGTWARIVDRAETERLVAQIAEHIAQIVSRETR